MQRAVHGLERDIRGAPLLSLLFSMALEGEVIQIVERQLIVGPVGNSLE